MQQMTRAVESEADKVRLHMNADNYIVMVTQAWNDDTSIDVEKSAVFKWHMTLSSSSIKILLITTMTNA